MKAKEQVASTTGERGCVSVPHCPACGHPDEGGVGAEYVDELNAALRETVSTLRRIHVRVRVNDGVDLDWIEHQAKFMRDRWEGKSA